MNVTYPGPHDGVNVLALSRNVKRGETIEVDPELGALLVAQGWTEGKAATVGEIKAAVGDDPAAARDALAAEQATEKPRKSLIDHLQSVIDANPAEAETQEGGV